MKHTATRILLAATLLGLTACGDGPAAEQDSAVEPATLTPDDAQAQAQQGQQADPLVHDPALEMTGTREQGYAIGRAEAVADWENGEAVRYQIGEPTAVYFDGRTGLVIDAIAGCCVTDYILGRHAGYNEYINAQIAAHGLPEYNRLEWAEAFTHPNRAFNNSNRIHRLAPEAEPVEGPGGVHLQWVIGEDDRGVLVLTGADGREMTRFDWGAGPYDYAMSFVWGPEGSDVIYIQQDRPEDDEHGDVFQTYDLRSGRILGYRRGTDTF